MRIATSSYHLIALKHDVTKVIVADARQERDLVLRRLLRRKQTGASFRWRQFVK